MMPKLDGLEVCRQLKADKSLPFMPIILVTARSDTKDVVAGLDVGGDEYLTKPVDQAALVARVRSMLRIKELHDTVHEQASASPRSRRSSRSGTARSSSAWPTRWPRSSAWAGCRRFLSPQIAELDRLLGRRKACWKAIAARSPWCSATCAASPASPRPPSRRR